jgi:hypothetical protein
MAGEKLVWRTAVFSYGGQRISRAVNTVELPLRRSEVESSMFESVGYDSEKGVWEPSISFSGAFSTVENALVDGLAADDGGAPAIFFRDSTAKPLAPGGTPAAVAALGSPAMFLNARLYDLDVEQSRGDLHKFTARLRPTTGRTLVGKVLYTNVGTAALGVAAAIVTPNLLVGVLGAGQLLTCAVAAVDPPGVPGTTPVAPVKLVHDIDGTFATPIAAHTFANFTAPGAQIVTLDGDVTPLAGETHWALEIGPITGTGAGFTFMAAICLYAK